MAFSRSISLLFLMTSLALQALHLNGQITSSCSSLATVSSLTPCMNYITNSSPTGGSPSTDCCNIMKSVMSGGVGCLCFIASGGVPFQLPINRNLTLSLPRACQMPGVSVQCKAPAAASPASSIPMPLSPKPAPGLSGFPTSNAIPRPALSPESDANPTLTPPSPTTASETPATNSGSRVSPSPSSATTAASTATFSTLLLLGVVAALVLY